jgi:hypothetical protein
MFRIAAIATRENINPPDNLSFGMDVWDMNPEGRNPFD